MYTRRMPVHICVNISIPATWDHLPRGDTLAANRQCPLVAGTTVRAIFNGILSYLISYNVFCGVLFFFAFCIYYVLYE